MRRYTLTAMILATGMLCACGGGGGGVGGGGAPPGQPRLEFVAQPTGYGAGASFALQVRLLDGSGVLVPADAVAIDLAAAGSLTDLLGGLQALTVAGVATFSNLSIEVAGTGYRIEATAGGYEAALSDAFAVTNGPGAQLRLVVTSDPVLRASPATVTVTVLDAFGNAALDYAGSVGLNVSDPTASVPPPYGFVPADQGEHDFQVTFRLAGGQNIGAADVSDPGILGSVAVSVLNVAVINEVLYDDVGTDGEDVFIELYGEPGESLDGYHLVGVNGATGTVYATIALSGTIPGDGLFVVSPSTANAALAAVTDLVDDGADLQNGPDELILYLDYGGPDELEIDALAYGTITAYSGAGEGNPAPDVAPGSSLARQPDGQDTDDNVSDFLEVVAPTPGAPN